ncbi:MAG TPA: HAD family hydrolase [Allosphingosinicella sp.]|jgi:phosphoglycolate phosphatase-like HAD superfamily hydrolase
MIAAVLFDVDGTLVDSNDLHAAAWQEAFRHFGLVVPFDAIRGQIGKGGDNLIPSLLPREIAERLQEDIESFRSDLFQRDYLRRCRPFPGAVALLRRLDKEGVHLVLASSAKQAEIDFHIERLGCADALVAKTSADDVEHSKPCPDIFAAALDKVLPVMNGGQAVVVGDTPYDIAAAAKIGLPAVAVRCGGFPDQELQDAAAIFDGPIDLDRHFPAWLPR